MPNGVPIKPPMYLPISSAAYVDIADTATPLSAVSVTFSILFPIEYP